MKRINPIELVLRIVLVAAFVIPALLSLVSCGSNHYSPLDSYIKGSIESQEANVKAEREARLFIDSLNCK